MQDTPFAGRLAEERSDDWEVDASLITLCAPKPQYPVAICAGWRVVADRLQWRLQHFRTPAWRNRSYCRTRAGLELAIRENTGKPYQSAVAHFPDWHPDVAAAPAPVMRVEAPAEVVCRRGPARTAATVPLPPLKAENYPLEFYPDGYPKLPAFLDRRKQNPGCAPRNRTSAYCVTEQP